MKKIKVLEGQNIFDIALQEYGTIEAVFEIIENNPNLAGSNDFPRGYVSDETIDFYLSLPINEGIELLINESSELTNKQVKDELNIVISD